MSYYRQWAPYVPVAQRRRRALTKMTQLRKKGQDIRPIEIEGRKIATTFWGKAWCDHIESLGDFANRLPRGRTYVRNGSVCHLAIEKGCATALVSGSSLYEVKVKIDVLPKAKWTKVKSRCAGQIGSLLELLQGRLSDQVMGVVTDSNNGLFPLSKEIRLGCSCPDWATMCKHVAAALYGVGARLDEQPDLLFLLRGVKLDELISANAKDAVNRATRRGGKRPQLASSDLGEVFGIELDPSSGRSKASVGANSQTVSATKKRPVEEKKIKPVATRRKKSVVGRKSATSTAKNFSVTTTKKRVSNKKSPKKKSASQKSKQNGNVKTVKRPVKKTATSSPKKKTSTRTVKKSAANKPVAKKKAATSKKSAPKKKPIASKITKRRAAKRRPTKKRASKK